MSSYKTVFLFAYYSFKDPVFQSAVLPYFYELSKIEPKLRIVLLTFEQKRYALEGHELEVIRNELEEHQIFWYQGRWHSGSFKKLKKILDFFWGIIKSIHLILNFKAQIIYSEGFPGSIIGHFLSRITRLPHIVHSFEPHAEYMMESSVWSNNDWEYRFLKIMEKKVAYGAKYIITGTSAYSQIIKSWGTQAEILTIPSCVDAKIFLFSNEDRLRVRKEHGVLEDEIVIVYLGKFGGMYMDSEIFEFIKVCEFDSSLNYKYWIFTSDDQKSIIDKIKFFGLPKEKFIVKFLEKQEISQYLSASDFGFVAVKPYPNKRYCSPIKDGEYWSCGLPIIIPHGISDDYILADQEDIGIVLTDISFNGYRKVCSEIMEWQTENRIHIAKRCRQFAKLDRSIEKVQQQFVHMLMNL